MTDIPSFDVLPPMSPRMRDLMYGVLAWAAFLITVVTVALAVVPDWTLPKWFFVLNAGINALWTLGGFKAKANVSTATK